MMVMDGRKYLKNFGNAIIAKMEAETSDNVDVTNALKIAALWTAYNAMHEGLEYYGSHYGRIGTNKERPTM